MTQSVDSFIQIPRSLLRGFFIDPSQLHGWVYEISEGLFIDLNWREEQFKQLEHIYNSNLQEDKHASKGTSRKTPVEQTNGTWTPHELGVAAK